MSIQRALFLLLFTLCACDFGEQTYSQVADTFLITGVEVETYDRRPGVDGSPFALSDSLSREFWFSVGGRGRYNVGWCNPDPCQQSIEVLNRPVRIEIYLDTTVVIDDEILIAGTNLAVPLSLSESNLLTFRYVLVGPRGPGVRLDPERVLIPDGRRTIRVRWLTEDPSETFEDSTIVEWRRFGF